MIADWFYRFSVNFEARKCEECPNYICQQGEDILEVDPVEAKIGTFFANLRSLSVNMSDLVSPLTSVQTISSDQFSSLEDNVKTALMNTYHDRVTAALNTLDECDLDDETDFVKTSDQVNIEETTTLTPESTTTDLPLCSEVSSVTEAPKIGSGLLSKFGVTLSTAKPVPCREDEDTTETTPES